VKRSTTETKSRGAAGDGRPRATAAPKPGRPDTYHHGSLRTALLEAAERVLERDGINGLTLRAAAREAGVSHAAPKNHFGDLSGLLSELAAVGFERFVATMEAGVHEGDAPAARMAAIGRGYVAFARSFPGLFLLMFRSERLDVNRPALRAAIEASSRVLSGAIGESRGEEVQETLSLPQAASIVAAWSLVHGFAMLLLDGRLKGLLSRLPPGTDANALLSAVFSLRRPPG
jgi:AcrR family transcriptional regulator